MNPALMNYLQNNQLSNQTTGMQPQPQQGAQPARPGQDSYNPFDAGIQKAISSARQSLGMTAEQEDAALRGSMLTFADNMSQQPRQKGFFNNFASFGKALSPAIQAHDQSEQAALTQNNALANQILAYQAAEQQKEAQHEERLWHRQHAENQLGEQRRYHDMFSQMKMNQEANRVEREGDKTQNAAWLHRENNNTTKLIPKIADQYQKNEETLPSVDNFINLLSTTKLSGASKMAELRRFVAQQTGGDEDILTANNLGQFYIEWMNNNNKGVMSDQDAKRYVATFAGIDKNPNASIKLLKELKSKIEREQQILSTKLQAYEEDQGANLNSINILNRKMNVPNKLNALPSINPQSNSNPDIVEMKNANGKLFRIPKERVQEAMDDAEMPLTMVGK